MDLRRPRRRWCHCYVVTPRSSEMWPWCDSRQATAGGAGGYLSVVGDGVYGWDINSSAAEASCQSAQEDAASSYVSHRRARPEGRVLSSLGLARPSPWRPKSNSLGREVQGSPLHAGHWRLFLPRRKYSTTGMAALQVLRMCTREREDSEQWWSPRAFAEGQRSSQTWHRLVTI